MKRNMSKSEKVRRYFMHHPQASVADASKACKVTPAYIYNIRGQMRKDGLMGDEHVTTFKIKSSLPPIEHYYTITNNDGTTERKFINNMDEAMSEINRLNEWCLEWREKCKRLELLDSEAARDVARLDAKLWKAESVIEYMEERIVRLTNELDEWKWYGQEEI